MTSRFKSLHRTLAFVAERPKKRKRKSDNTCKIHSLIKGFREIPKCCSSSSEEGTKKKTHVFDTCTSCNRRSHSSLRITIFGGFQSQRSNKLVPDHVGR